MAKRAIMQSFAIPRDMQIIFMSGLSVPQQIKIVTDRQGAAVSGVLHQMMQDSRLAAPVCADGAIGEIGEFRHTQSPYWFSKLDINTKYSFLTFRYEDGSRQS